MADAAGHRFRAPVGILEAAMLLVIAGMALWSSRPFPASRAAAAEERSILSAIGTVADIEDSLGGGKRGVPRVPLPRLLAVSGTLREALREFTPSPVAGVYGNRSYWLTVLLPGKEGWLAAPGQEEPGEAVRGYCVVAWPKKDAADMLRAVAALPKGVMWQRADAMEESGNPNGPPVPRVAFPPPGSSDPVPDPPPDWAMAKRRKQ
jgi:hypothetical protein